MSQRTQVTTIGACPAGLLLSPLLHPKGIESVILEARHHRPGMDSSQSRLPLTGWTNVVRSRAVATNLAENDVAIPLTRGTQAVPWGKLAKQCCP